MRLPIILLFCLLLFLPAFSQPSESHYIPSPANLEARKEFQDMKFGMFIHWGVFSLLGDGEWVMNNRNIKVNDYKRLMHVYDPVYYDPAEWVRIAKDAGMKYITLITRHHDGFSNWDSKATDWKITNTPYGKDVLKMLADECHRQGMKLFVYYSLLDWSREDYPHQTGRTGHGTGRAGEGDYNHYLQFMKQQLTELLTNYGEIAGVWFDGHWDQTPSEGTGDRPSRIDWHYDEIYSLIHRLQPQCMIGNNHHLTPFEGEDFQMFERDVPGENKAGLSFQKPSDKLPLETCETMNDSWGYNITDRNYKSVKQCIDLLVNSATRDANLLLNIGPMANGRIQPEFADTLAAIGAWMKQYGNTIYGTRGKLIPPQPWGGATYKGKTVYLHILKKPDANYIFIPAFTEKIEQSATVNQHQAIRIKQQAEGTFFYLDNLSFDGPDTIIEVKIK